MQETEPLVEVSSIYLEDYSGVSLFYLNLPNLIKMRVSSSREVTQKIKRIPYFFRSTPLLQELYFGRLYDSDIQMILDTCPMLKKIEISSIENDADFIDNL